MGGGGVARLILSCGGPRRCAAEQGFTLVETMIAMAVAIAVLLANVYLFNRAQKDLAQARAVTAATNLATSKIADFRAMTIDAVNATATINTGGALYVRRGCEYVTDGGEVFAMVHSAGVCRCKTNEYDSVGQTFACDGETDVRRTLFKRTWVVSAIDLEHATPPVADLVGDLAKIKVDVLWPSESAVQHRVTLTTFTTGAAP